MRGIGGRRRGVGRGVVVVRAQPHFHLLSLYSELIQEILVVVMRTRALPRVPARSLRARFVRMRVGFVLVEFVLSVVVTRTRAIPRVLTRSVRTGSIRMRMGIMFVEFVRVRMRLGLRECAREGRSPARTGARGGMKWGGGGRRGALGEGGRRGIGGGVRGRGVGGGGVGGRGVGRRVGRSGVGGRRVGGRGIGFDAVRVI